MTLQGASKHLKGLRRPGLNEQGREGQSRACPPEAAPPERIATAEGFEAMPGHEYVATVTLDEHEGKTTLRSHLLYQSPEDRDGHIQSGMEPGMRETYDRLAELLATMA